MPSALKMVVDSTEANADATMQGIYAAVRMRHSPLPGSDFPP